MFLSLGTSIEQDCERFFLQPKLIQDVNDDDGNDGDDDDDDDGDAYQELKKNYMK